MKKVYNSDNVLVDLIDEPSLKIVKDDSEEVEIFSLYTFRSVTDMFKNYASIDSDETQLATFKFADWYYKIELSYASDNYTYYVNRFNLDFASVLKSHFEKYANQNYTVIVTNRYNKSITFSVSTLGQDYSLSDENLTGEYTNGQWNITPSKLNFSIGENVNYYVAMLTLKDLSVAESREVKYEFNNKGVIVKIDDVPVEVGENIIILTAGHEYSVTFVDCAGKEYSKLIYAYENPGNYSLTALGNSSIISNVIYTANPVVLRYNKNIYTNTNQQIKILKDGVQIFNGSLNFVDGENIIIGGVKYAERVFETNDSSYTTIYFYPHLESNS